ncbi:C-GCAxxG-C-C family (seleno)protein [uncultured Methanospirillum sp.]|uniref:C-GCAxxG-C-C family (seleno)protein n=1 Tax=uncultured Methanospirillum sp. TaxID=262503 RepID=UPI0029C65CC7|nr:C-GCAxxG-C-C family (seleno)protein [uncultured Methanospirillum sp.]
MTKIPKSVDTERIRKTAEAYYRNLDYYCSEAIVKTINEEFDLGYPEEVIKLASGFPIGMGGSGCSCGAVVGGIMALGMVFGRTAPKDEQVKKCMALAHELHEKFRTRHTVLCCRILTKDMELGSSIHMQQCVEFTGEVAEETAKIIIRELAGSFE